LKEDVSERVVAAQPIHALLAKHEQRRQAAPLQFRHRARATLGKLIAAEMDVLARRYDGHDSA
jgi:hypothetical protein